MTLAAVLRLGRVSNLPTVWTNALAGIALAGVSPWQWATLPTTIGLSLAYVGGMCLNDAFDRVHDARERPTRPIPSGEVDANTAFALGFLLLLAAVAMLLAAASGFGVPPAGAVLAGLALGTAIIGYDWHHKGNPLSPLAMGACRLLAYVAAGLAAAAALPGALLAAAAVSLGYLIGLTYVAKREIVGQLGALWPLLFLAAPLAYGAARADGPAGWLTLVALAAWIGAALWLLLRRRPGDIPRAIVSLIAGIALLDAMLLADAGRPGAVPLAWACFAATLAMQRWISGT
jgi:hypothetical protein